MYKSQKINRHLCFICDRAWPMFTDCDVKVIGGVETRSVRLAVLMLPYFEKVSFAFRKTDNEIIDTHGLSIALYEPAVISNAPNIDLAKINADIYIVFESHHYTADAVRTCNILGKPVVYWCTSSIDFDIRYKMDNHEQYYWQFVGRESAYCFYMANHIICQTEDQKRELFSNHRLPSIVIRNPVEISTPFKQKKFYADETLKVLWIGRTDPIFKQPEKLLEVAKQLPHVKFLMILNNTDNVLFYKIQQQKTNNVEILEYVSPEKMVFIYEKNDILLSTSSSEGFSNVFLEAIKYGMPIVSLQVDPDGMFKIHNCGICCDGKVEKVVETINNLQKNKIEAENISRNAYYYISKKHSSKMIIKQMVKFFSSVSLEIKFPMKWTDYSYNRINDILLSELQNAKLMKQSKLNWLISSFRKKN